MTSSTKASAAAAVAAASQQQSQISQASSSNAPSTQLSSSHAPLASLAAHWNACCGDIPPPLVGASATLIEEVNPIKAKLYLFGGRLVTTRRMVNDLYELDLITLRWTKLSDDDADSSKAPQARYFHSCNLWRNKLVIFGGMGYENGYDAGDLCVLDEVSIYDLATGTWDFDFIPSPSTQQQRDLAPQPRYAHLSSIASESSIVIIGGQDMANRYVEEVNVLDLERREWVHKQSYAKQRGSYRSLSVESQWKVQYSTGEGQKLPRDTSDGSLSSAKSATSDVEGKDLLSTKNLNLLPMSVKERDAQGDLKPLPVYVYTNFNFTDVKREMEGLVVSGGDRETSSLSVNIEDHSNSMTGVSLPPGLRFPTGAILGTHLLISGTYLANTSQTFAIWALHLPTMTWNRLDIGPLLATGSWNRGVLWPTQNRLIVFGNRDRDLVADYNHRQTNWDHVLIIELEAWGITQPPMRPMKVEAMQVGLKKLASTTIGSFSTASECGIGPVDRATGVPHLSYGGRGDFEIVCSDGMRLGCDRAILEKRWPWFATRMRDYHRRVKASAKIMINGHAKKSSGTSTTASSDPLTALLEEDESGDPLQANTVTRADPRITPRQLHIGEPSPVVLALLVYFYTGSICTQLQQHPAVVAALLIVAKVYDMRDLEQWAKHAAHVVLSRDLAPPANGASAASMMSGTPASLNGELAPLERHRLAVAIYEAATLSGFEALQIRSLRTVMSIAKWIQRTSTSSGHSSEKAESSYDVAADRSGSIGQIGNVLTGPQGSANKAHSASGIPSDAVNGLRREAQSGRSTPVMEDGLSRPRGNSLGLPAPLGMAPSLSRTSTQSGHSGGSSPAMQSSQNRKFTGANHALPTNSTSLARNQAPPVASSNSSSGGRKRFSIFGRGGGDSNASAAKAPAPAITSTSEEQEQEDLADTALHPTQALPPPTAKSAEPLTMSASTGTVRTHRAYTASTTSNDGVKPMQKTYSRPTTASGDDMGRRPSSTFSKFKHAASVKAGSTKSYGSDSDSMTARLIPRSPSTRTQSTLTNEDSHHSSQTMRISNSGSQLTTKDVKALQSLFA